MMGTMAAVVKKAPAPGAVLERVAIPSCGPEDVLLKVRAASICGTDLHIYAWDGWAQSVIKPPLVFGHEITGEVVEAGGGVESFVKGDAVSVESHVPCGRCYQCAHDMRHICDSLEIVGVHRQGGFAEYVAIPAVCAWKNPRGMPVEVAALLEPMGNGVYAASEAEVQGKTAAVFGCGPTGLFTVAAARAMGAERVFAVDVNPLRRELARAMGADEFVDGAAPGVVETLIEKARGHGLDVTFEMSGAQEAVTNALRSLRKGGTMVAFGLPTRPIEVNLANDVVIRGRRILGIVGRHMFRTWETMQRLLDAGKLDPLPLVTHRYKLAEFEEAFRKRSSTETPVGKVLMFP